ncbi:CDP-alcohol phosphatidyltransferase [Streptomyces sp. NPDC058440]|uniref:CDP-alcohol phosphatidyltransferase n=1 Tax=Streptomyces sp. NPDC058440 TaxID=3346501 RepID=UPI00364A6628
MGAESEGVGEPDAGAEPGSGAPAGRGTPGDDEPPAASETEEGKPAADGAATADAEASSEAAAETDERAAKGDQAAERNVGAESASKTSEAADEPAGTAAEPAAKTDDTGERATKSDQPTEAPAEGDQADEPAKAADESAEAGEPTAQGAQPTEPPAERDQADEPAKAAAEAAEADEPTAQGDQPAEPPAERDRAAEPAEATAEPAKAAAIRPWQLRKGRRGWQGAHPVAARRVSHGVTLLALLLVAAALLLPNKEAQFQVAAFTRLPVEVLLLGGVLLVLPRRPRVAVAVLGGLALGVLTVLNLTDIEFNQYLGRSFDVVLDWELLDDAQSYLADTLGGTTALLAAAGVVLLVLAVLTVMALAVVRLGDLLARDKARSTRGLLFASVVWMTCMALDIQISGVPVASQHTVAMVKYHDQALRTTIRDERDFARTAEADQFGGTPAGELVPDLRGKDMIFTFIESYGRSAIEDPIPAPGVTKTLDTSTEALAEAGFHARTGWLTSATYGGGSWLGHSTFMSGLWVDNQNRYRTVTSSDHLTLTEAFKKTGAWDTVGVMPGVQKGWPESKWYGLDKVYNAFQMGYEGPKFSWSTMPDQYALEAFQRLEHGKKRDKPLTSFVILTSSHQPWAPVPEMVDWDKLGDGSVYKGIEAAGNRPADVLTSSTRSSEEYGKSVEYSVTALTQWLERYGKDDTVLVVLGDHQPNARVSGDHASRDVPCSIIAKDPKVLDKIADWGWTEGLRPDHDAPVWKMSDFRDRFLTAYGSTPHPSKG